MDKESVKKKISEMEDEEKEFLKECLGVSKDVDLVDSFLKLEGRVKLLEEKKEVPAKKKGFFDGFWD